MQHKMYSTFLKNIAKMLHKKISGAFAI